MAKELTRGEAIQILTMHRDLMEEATTKELAMKILEECGDKVGYTPAFRCLVKGLEPEESIRWRD